MAREPRGGDPGGDSGAGPRAGSAFDVIVVGAGGSGAPLAARLAGPGCRVLLLEAGPAPGTVAGLPPELLDAGIIRGADPAHPDNWALPAQLTAGRPYSIARGRVLGGSTTVNGGYFVRARRADHDDWGAAGNDEWSYEACLPFSRALETDEQYGPLAAPRPGPDDARAVATAATTTATALHGSSGPMPVTRPAVTREGAPHPVTAAFAAAAGELGFALEADKNGEQPPGHGPLPMNVRGGIRWNTALAYLLPLGTNPDLVVRGDATVRRVLFEGTRAVGVELADGEVVRAGREVVLAAGGILTPHLLLVSGVGPRDELARHGIRVVAESPGVGVGFSDHPQVQLTWRPRPGITGPEITPPGIATPGASTTAAPGGWPGPAMEWVLNAPPEQPGGADIEVLPLLKPMGYLLHGVVAPDDPPDLALLVALQREAARGTIRLASADPAVLPEIDYDYLSVPADHAGLRRAVRLAARLVGTRAFAAVSEGLTNIDEATLADDSRLDSWVRSNLGTAIHLCGSARMGPADDPGAVVDQHGRVRGVTGLRIADTSILPTAPRRGPAATAVLIGERVAAFLRDGD
ncbi:GMC family oxidoreductase [Herbiconiux daphne]|uniref:GMC family oxidoreductase N-terminal domain-containing protein n=1 Tax=Herbiconiux daphne TaxID=2970914 RepID=A0ABT2H154_9MICO|nr:GMC family oxidoreductase N-terminal domain-containing protein [Herbiconiux daphne]MCS5733678.1 GMC family oxidoreductase N-terminal domain-containing protein [Herbiconiux daphne]